MFMSFQSGCQGTWVPIKICAVSVCSCACICACEHQHLQCFPACLEGIEFTMWCCIYFLRGQKQMVHLLPHGLFLFRRVVSSLADSAARCCCEAGILEESSQRTSKSRSQHLFLEEALHDAIRRLLVTGLLRCLGRHLGTVHTYTLRMNLLWLTC